MKRRKEERKQPTTLKHNAGAGAVCAAQIALVALFALVVLVMVMCVHDPQWTIVLVLTAFYKPPSHPSISIAPVQI